MERSLINRKQAQLIASLLFIVIGLFSLVQDIKAGILLIVIGLGVSNQIQGWIKMLIEESMPFIKRLLNEDKTEQKTSHSKESVALNRVKAKNINIKIIKNQSKRKK